MADQTIHPTPHAQCIILAAGLPTDRPFNFMTVMLHRGFCTLVLFINPRHACAATVTVLGLSVYDTTGNEAACERYQQLQCNKCSKNRMGKSVGGGRGVNHHSLCCNSTYLLATSDHSTQRTMCCLLLVGAIILHKNQRLHRL